jgi:CRP-like cAMP-binding protein
MQKNDVLLSEGKCAKDCYFIIQGCVRSYYGKEGEGRNTNFFKMKLSEKVTTK